MGGNTAVHKWGRSRFKRRAGLSGGKLYAVIVVAIAAILIVPLFVIFQASGGGSGGSSGQSSQTSSSLSPAQQQVASRVNELAKEVGNLNTTGVVGLYAGSAVVKWYGSGINSSTPFKAGTFKAGNISALYTTVFGLLAPAGGKNKPIDLAGSEAQSIVSGLSIRSVSPNTVNASFGLYLNFTSGLLGYTGARVTVQQQWTNQGGNGGAGSGWYIVSDSWDFTASSVQFPPHG